MLTNFLGVPSSTVVSLILTGAIYYAVLQSVSQPCRLFRDCLSFYRQYIDEEAEMQYECPYSCSTTCTISPHGTTGHKALTNPN